MDTKSRTLRNGGQRNDVHVQFINIHILKQESLVIRDIKSWTRRCDWLLDNLDSSVLIGCLLWKLLHTFNYQPISTPDSRFSVTNQFAGFKILLVLLPQTLLTYQDHLFTKVSSIKFYTFGIVYHFQYVIWLNQLALNIK